MCTNGSLLAVNDIFLAGKSDYLSRLDEDTLKLPSFITPLPLIYDRAIYYISFPYSTITEIIGEPKLLKNELNSTFYKETLNVKLPKFRS